MEFPKRTTNFQSCFGAKIPWSNASRLWFWSRTSMDVLDFAGFRSRRLITHRASIGCGPPILFQDRTCLFSAAELLYNLENLNCNIFIILFAVLHSAIKRNTFWQAAMEAGEMLEPVDQSGPPAPQSAPCTPQKSSEKIQDNDGPNCGDDEY